MKSTRDIGRLLEEYVLAKVKELDPAAKIYSNCKQKDIMCNFAFGECLSGDTKIYKCAGGKAKGIITLEELYNKSIEKRKSNYHAKSGKNITYISKNTNWFHDGNPSIYSLNLKNKKIIQQQIKKIIFSGIKNVFEIKTRLGFSIKASKEHKFLTNNGWKTVEQLKQNDCVAVTCWGWKFYKREFVRRPTKKLMLQIIRQIGKCQKCNNKTSLEVHHKDGDFTNNIRKNLQVLCRSCHLKEPKTGKTYNRKLEYFYDNITYIKSRGKNRCFDIMMSEDENTSNYIANEFIVHNCKKRNTKDFTIKESVWLHLNNNLPINTTKFCFMVHENVNGKRLITLDCDDFFRILRKAEQNE
jgi:5-methylcytosine-specific restriction endonuclease McrA